MQGPVSMGYLWQRVTTRERSGTHVAGSRLHVLTGPEEPSASLLCNIGNVELIGYALKASFDPEFIILAGNLG
jgi:hypothetical protein